MTAHRSWLVAVAIAIASGALTGLIGANSAAGQSPVSVPGSSDSAKAAAALSQFPGGDRVSAILVIARTDSSPLTSGDLAAVEQASDRMPRVPQALPGAPVTTSADGKAAIATVTLSVELSGFELNDAVKALRAAPADGLPPELTAHITGGPAFGAAIANAFTGANVTLLVLTVLTVALVLIATYREADHRAALRRAVRAAGPAILASNATVVLALLTLILAVTPSTRSLGACAACGLMVAAIFVLLVLPPLLALCGRRVFWPFIPRAGDAQTTTTGGWHRVADAVGQRPALVCAVAVTVLVALATGLLGTDVGLSQTQQFRVRADSVDGFTTLAAHFPGGTSDPTVVIASTARAPAGRHRDTDRGIGDSGQSVTRRIDTAIGHHRRWARQ